MNHEELLKNWQEDCRIDDTELATESTRIPVLHGKYLQLLHMESLRLKQLKIEEKQLKKVLIEYYRGDLNNPESLAAIKRDPWERKILKNEVDIYVDSDWEMVELQKKIAYREAMVDVAKDILRAIHNRSHTIHNALNFMRLTMGN